MKKLSIILWVLGGAGILFSAIVSLCTNPTIYLEYIEKANIPTRAFFGGNGGNSVETLGIIIFLIITILIGCILSMMNK